MKARRKNSPRVWSVEQLGASLVQVFSGQIRELVTCAEFERDWILA